MKWGHIGLFHRSESCAAVCTYVQAGRYLQSIYLFKKVPYLGNYTLQSLIITMPQSCGPEAVLLVGLHDGLITNQHRQWMAMAVPELARPILTGG